METNQKNAILPLLLYMSPTSTDHLAYKIQGLHSSVAEDMSFQICDAGQVVTNVLKDHGAFV